MHMENFNFNKQESKESQEKKGLSLEEFKKVQQAALDTVAERGSNYYGWVNAPELSDEGKLEHTSGWGENQETKEISPAEALEIMNQKLDGAYGERFIMSLGTIASLIENEYNVRFVQFQEEEGTPFDAQGWTVMVVETMPVFHISPEDLKLENVGDLVEILQDNSTPDVSWKNTNKVGEFQALLKGSIEPNLDLVKIAQEGSE